jgi:hypothetical protein
LGLDHAFYEVVYCFFAVTCFAACLEAFLSFALVAFAWRMQLEQRLNARQFLEY